MCDSFTSFCLSDQWSAVCGSGWSYNESLVVCKQLDYPSAVHYNGTGAAWQAGKRPAWTCTGNESKLDECSSSERNVQNCTDGIQAEVACGKSNES